MPGVFQMGYLAASLCCIGGITGLASQKTARIGNALGLIGCVYRDDYSAVCSALPAAAADAGADACGIGWSGWDGDWEEGGCDGAAADCGGVPMRWWVLPAVMTSISSFYIHPVEMHTALHKIAAYLGTLIGGITFTGSIAAFLKLSGYKTGHLNLPYGNYLNQPLGILNLLSMIAFVKSHTIGPWVRPPPAGRPVLVRPRLEHHQLHRQRRHARRHHRPQQLLGLGPLRLRLHARQTPC
jgi:NAD(P) transhydrogenase